MPFFQENPIAGAIEAEIEAIYCLYAGLASGMDPQTGLGGKLLYAGEPNHAGCGWLRAANIAGAASLAASADAAVLRRAMHQGAIDFVVNSLDEALRILKNEIRKKQPVAVGVSLSPGSLLKEMMERGVQPDLLPQDAWNIPASLTHGARLIVAQPLPEGKRFRFAMLPPNSPSSDFDNRLLDSLPPGDALNRRWIRLAPRYLPPAARRIRLLVEPAG